MGGASWPADSWRGDQHVPLPGLTPASLLGLLLWFGPTGASPTVAVVDRGVCPGAAMDVDRAIAGLLREDASEHVEVDARVQLVDAGPVGLRLELEIASHAGTEQHELTGPDCERLIDRAALLIASAVDPFLYSWSPRGETAQRHRRAVMVQHPRVESPAPTVAPTIAAGEPGEPSEPSDEFGPLAPAEPADERSRPPISGAVSVGATTFVGLFPQIGGGIELEGALERGALRWQTTVSAAFGGRFRSTEADVGGDLWALGLGTALCGVPEARRVRVPLCAVAGAGFITAQAVGTVEARQITQPWAWAGAEGRVLLVAREHLAIGLGLGAHAALVRPAWEVQSPGVRFTVPPVMGVLRLTVEARQLRRGNSARSGITSR